LPDGAPIQLRNGTAFSSETGKSGASKDGEIALVQDEALHPMPARDLRLIKLTRSHLTGSGSWDDIYIFRCVEGKVTQLFQKSFLHGVKIDKSSDVELTLTSCEWMNNDARGCPSKERIATYQRSAKDGTFKEIRSILHPSEEK
jgi:hypothetical protein